jgi:excisionase family DNA binding protein
MFSGYPDLMTIEDLQKACGIGRTTAYRLINSGAIKHLRLGKVIKIPRRYLIAFVLSACYTEGATDPPSREAKKL